MRRDKRFLLIHEAIEYVDNDGHDYADRDRYNYMASEAEWVIYQLSFRGRINAIASWIVYPIALLFSAERRKVRRKHLDSLTMFSKRV